MKILGALKRRDGTVFSDLRAARRPRSFTADGAQDSVAGRAAAGVFVSVRARREPPVPDPLVLTDPVASDMPAGKPADPAALIARHLQADCFHFVTPGAAHRRG